MRQYYLSTCLLAFFGLLLFASCSSQRVASNKLSKKAAVANNHRPAAPAPSEKVAKADKAEIVITNARAYLGTPYRYGGTDRKGIDCSGLLLCSFREADISLPRTSAEQSSYGKAVSIQQLQPGDLVFFSAKKWKGKVSHAGLVTEVRGRDEIMFIHSSTSKGVVESNLLSPYYRNIFVKARRPF